MSTQPEDRTDSSSKVLPSSLTNKTRRKSAPNNVVLPSGGSNSALIICDLAEDRTPGWNAFHGHKEEEAVEVSSRYNNILKNLKECLEQLPKFLKNTGAEPYFLTFLQYLLSTQEVVFGAQDLYKLLKDCVTQIELHQSGVDLQKKPQNTEQKVKKPVEIGKFFQVLDEEEGQNLSLRLRELKMSFKEINRCLVEMDEGKLTLAFLEILVKIMPKQEQINQLALKDKYLPEPEQFIEKMPTREILEPRLKSMIIEKKFKELVSDIEHDIVVETEACEEVKKSEKFSDLLQLIQRLSDIKTHDNKATLIDSLAQIVAAKHFSIMNFPDELIHIREATRVSIENIQGKLSDLEKSIEQLELEIKKVSSANTPGDRFAEVMNKFIISAKSKYEVLNKEMEGLYKSVAVYFCLDPKHYILEDMSVDI